MTSFSSLSDPVSALATGAGARVVDVVGASWRHYYRFLHPAGDLQDGRPVAVSWRRVAERRGVNVDLGTAQWHEVSGVRLHTDRHSPHVDLEPEVGPNPAVLAPVVSTLVKLAPTPLVRLAEWTGYGSAVADRPLNGAELCPSLTIGRESYTVWEMPPEVALALLRGGDETRPAGPRGALADYVWTLDWLVVADGDLASTYLGTTTPRPTWPAELEWVEVAPDAPIS